MTTTQIVKRAVARIETPDIGKGYSDQHRNRLLVPPGNWSNADPFLLLVEDWFPKGVFDRHPHRGFETVTYVIEGTIEHYDNHGNKGTIHAGDALWLTAGRGLIHNEVPANNQNVHSLQLWVNLPRIHKLETARFQELRRADLPVRREPGAEIRVFSGSSGSAESRTKNYAPITMVEIDLQPNAEVEQELPPGYNGFIVILKGAGTIGASAAKVGAGQVAWLTPSEAASSVALAGGENGIRAMLFAGHPLREPIAAQGPFVMNTEDELAIAFAEYRAQGERFGLGKS